MYDKGNTSILPFVTSSSSPSQPTTHMSFDWGTNVHIPCPPGGDGPIPQWGDLKFNPLGIYNLCRRLGALSLEPGVFTHFQENFFAADVAWMAAGLSKDGNHLIMPDTFHTLFSIVREQSPTGRDGGVQRVALQNQIRSLLFDLVGLLYFF